MLYNIYKLKPDIESSESFNLIYTPTILLPVISITYSIAIICIFGYANM